MECKYHKPWTILNHEKNIKKTEKKKKNQKQTKKNYIRVNTERHK